MPTETTTPRTTHADLRVKSKHAELLNRLSQMQDATCYAIAKPELAKAEAVIFQQEQDLTAAQAQGAEMRAVIQEAANDCYWCHGKGGRTYDSDPQGGMHDCRSCEPFREALSSTTLGAGWKSPEEVRELEEKLAVLQRAGLTHENAAICLTALDKSGMGRDGLKYGNTLTGMVLNACDQNAELTREVERLKKTISDVETSIKGATPEADGLNIPIVLPQRTYNLSSQLYSAINAKDEVEAELTRSILTNTELCNQQRKVGVERDATLQQCEAMRGLILDLETDDTGACRFCSRPCNDHHPKCKIHLVLSALPPTPAPSVPREVAQKMAGEVVYCDPCKKAWRFFNAGPFVCPECGQNCDGVIPTGFQPG